MNNDMTFILSADVMTERESMEELKQRYRREVDENSRDRQGRLRLNWRYEDIDTGPESTLFKSEMPRKYSDERVRARIGNFWLIPAYFLPRGALGIHPHIDDGRIFGVKAMIRIGPLGRGEVFVPPRLSIYDIPVWGCFFEGTVSDVVADELRIPNFDTRYDTLILLGHAEHSIGFVSESSVKFVQVALSKIPVRSKLPPVRETVYDIVNGDVVAVYPGENVEDHDVIKGRMMTNIARDSQVIPHELPLSYDEMIRS